MKLYFICCFVSNILLNRNCIHHNLSLCIPMDFPIQVNKVRMGLSIIYFKGSQVEISK